MDHNVSSCHHVPQEQVTERPGYSKTAELWRGDGSDHRGYISPVNVNADDAEESMEIERKMERLMQVIRRDREDEMEISDKRSSKTPAAVEEGAVNRPDGGHHHEPIYGGRFSTAWWLEMAMSYMFDVEKELIPGLQSKSPVVRHAICSAHASLRLARHSAYRAMGELSAFPAQTGVSADDANGAARFNPPCRRIRAVPVHGRIDVQMAAETAPHLVGGLRMKMEESALRKRLEEVEAQFLQQKVWCEKADVKVHELLEENSKLRAKLLVSEEVAAEAVDDFQYIMRHNKFLDSELRKCIRGRNKTISDGPSDSIESESDGEIRSLKEFRRIGVSAPRIPIKRSDVDAAPPANRSESSGGGAPRRIE
ncbi:hypothetical protein R1sor_010781 [Riccia sorocarpa]|uniref:Uncharacterized protein n=1 Tax=Riccia sorocarpa TaxID=122646 RepID=A0ABD3HZ04_9MARC